MTTHPKTTTDDRDQALIAGCLRHERLWQRQLFERFQRPMYTLVYRVLNDHDDAHDALQEGFIDVFRDLHQFRGGSLHGWIKTIMVRKALRRLRLEKRFEPLDSDTAALPQLIHWPDHITGPLLDQAIRALPPGYRAVFTMIEIEGFSHKETAQLLNISEGTSKSQLYHAKKQLQSQLKSLL